MDLTQGSSQQKNKRAKKMMLWFGIVSLIMSFGGLTSAFIVSSSREDWLNDFELPNSFFISTIIIAFSSLVFIASKKAIVMVKFLISKCECLCFFVLGLYLKIFHNVQDLDLFQPHLLLHKPLRADKDSSFLHQR